MAHRPMTGIPREAFGKCVSEATGPCTKAENADNSSRRRELKKNRFPQFNPVREPPFHVVVIARQLLSGVASPRIEAKDEDAAGHAVSK